MKIRTGVIGVGYLGKFHAQKYRHCPHATLAGVFDVDQTRSAAIAQSLECQSFSALNDLLQSVDALSIAAPTSAHFDLAKQALQRGKHVLIEKPITRTLDQARELIDLAQKGNLKLQVGHLERFNPVFRAMRDFVDRPTFIETIRIAPFDARNTDVDILMDVMIHDMDLILRLNAHSITSLDPVGISALSDNIDLSRLRVHFGNGSVADLTASRLSEKKERKIRVFQRNAAIMADLLNATMKIYSTEKTKNGNDTMVKTERLFDTIDQIQEEINLFIDSIRTDTRPPVTGEEGRDALSIMLDAAKLIERR